MKQKTSRKLSSIPSFPEAGLQFLRRLKRNNRREWFQERKPVYEEFVRTPMMAIVDAIAPELEQFAPDMMASHKVSLYRIYRDTRFSKDKSPYKTHVAAVFPPRNMEKHQGAGFYFHISPADFFVGGGLYSPDPKDLQAVRNHMALHFREFEAIVRAPRFRKVFGEISGEQLVRVPKGFANDHPAADYLKFKQLLGSRLLPVEDATSPAFGSIVLETFQTLYPFISFLNDPIRRMHKHRQRADLVLR